MALAVVVACYALFALGDYVEPAVAAPMQVYLGLPLVPMWILAVCLLICGPSRTVSSDGLALGISVQCSVVNGQWSVVGRSGPLLQRLVA